MATVREADPRGAVLAFVLQVLGALSALGVVLASRLALSAVLDERAADDPDLLIALLLLALFTALSGSVGVLQAAQQRLLGERVSQLVWRRLLRVTTSVDLPTYESTRFLQRLDRVRSNAVSRPVAVSGALLGLVGSGVGVAAMTAALLSIEPILVPVLLAAGIPSVLIARRSSRAEFDFAKDSTYLAQRRGYLKMLMSHRFSAAEVRAFGAGPGLMARHQQDDDAYLARLTTHSRLKQRFALLTVAASGVSLALALLVIVALVSANRIALPDAGAAAIAARLLAGQLVTVFRSVTSLIESGPFLRDLEGFLAMDGLSTEAGERRGLETGLAVRGATFSYPGATRRAVDEVDIDVPAGSVVALVGENGSGKTTLAKIIAGLYPAAADSITWDGEAIEPADLRASVTVLFQDFIRYQMSVADNVVMSDTSNPVDEDRLRAALDRVGVGSAIEALPRGLDTVLGIELEDGADLSGGQWQRLALARALYRDSPLVVLDEPSAALDPRAEHELFADVRRVLDGRSAVLISHRYSSVRLADHIYVMDGGRVIEHGSHAELVAAGGRYAELYELQSRTYLES
ncbi:ATP-binding cassette domain-containing protein [Nocardioides sp. YIM 123512]|uniref:ATP-binding cassette domain-containing protein n=1 Tax=Nocardioides flavescens TaxID=2691959 RepID=A0A6L7EZG3_9ACTN|nr:ABC transporter ATP-binding protein [Nocardioides flavescens]MXG89945.1 ATP-binding cassette domain-containing protein [Nocardioides flavescens]